MLEWMKRIYKTQKDHGMEEDEQGFSDSLVRFKCDEAANCLFSFSFVAVRMCDFFSKSLLRLSGSLLWSLLNNLHDILLCVCLLSKVLLHWFSCSTFAAPRY